MQIKNKSKIASLLTAAVCSLSLMGEEYPAEGTLELEYPLPPAAEEKFGSIPANRKVATNVWDIVEALRTNILYKQDRFLFGEGLVTDKTIYYKLTINGTSDTYNVPPPHPYVYVSGLNSSARVYGPNMHEMTRWDELSQIGYGVYGSANDKFVALTREGLKDTWSFSAMPVTGLVVQVDLEKQKTYEWSNPYDWRIMWQINEEDAPEVASTSTNRVVNTARVMLEVEKGVLKSSTADLYIDYLDEKNMPEFSDVTYTVEDGDASIEGSHLTANSSGVVKVKAVATDGSLRTADVSMYQWKTTTKSTIYGEDANINRKRVNDYMLGTLRDHRSAPNDTGKFGGSKANTGDHYTGEWGGLFFPYQHISTDSGGSPGYWWSHAPISKHVLLSAAHYGDYNHNRHLNGYEYFNVDGRMSGKTQLKCVKWYYLRDWAAEHGFEGTDAIGGDIAFWVVDGEVPDECLPYIATADWLNNYYGVDLDANKDKTVSTYMSGVTLNQNRAVRLKMCGGLSWGSCLYTGLTAEMSDGDKGYYSAGTANAGYTRADIKEYADLGGWYGAYVGDSGHPTYIFDPALQGVYEGTPFIRPILLSALTSTQGGTGISQYTKTIRAFCAWIAQQKGITIEEEMPYTLGDLENQSTDAKVIEQNAVNAMQLR